MTPDASAAQLIGTRYQLINKLGEGGMGAVYRTLDRLTGQTVALKQVHVPVTELQFASRPAAVGNTAALLALALEFRTLAGLRHPHIVGVLDYGFDAQRQPYFTMQLIEDAKSFTAYAAALDVAGKVRLLVAVLQALAYLHRRGIIHRDLKPANVLVTPEGVVKVMDFGLALHQTQSEAATTQGMIVGTLAYMAPELFSEHPASVASDLYALGVMAYELFVGRHPFRGENVTSMIMKVLTQVPDTSTLDPRLAGVITALLQKTPEQRYADSDAVIAALCAATDQPVPAEAAALRESFLQAAQFVGRKAEMAQLSAALERTMSSVTAANGAGSGAGSAWLIGGESGIGKSRLIDELRTRALVAGALVLRGQAVEGGGLPYQLWREPLRRLILSTPLSDLEASILKEIVPEIGTLLGQDIPDAPELEGQAGHGRLLLTVITLFKRHPQPLVLLLEDLQWTSESLELLQQLLPAVQTHPWLIVGSYRTDETPDLPDQLPEMQVLKLTRLDKAAVTELSAAMLGAAGSQPQVLDLLERETEGNTFFMVEVVRALAEEAGTLAAVGRSALPQSVFTGGVQQVVRRRLARVPGWAQAGLKIAAVAGRQLDLNLLRAAFATLPDQAAVQRDLWLTTCANAAILEVEENQWRFSHDKLREGLLADLSTAERRLLHRTVANATEQVYAQDTLYAEPLAEHWYAAGEIHKTLDWTLIAAEHLVQIVANYRRAQALIERGLSLNTDDDSGYRARLRSLLGDVVRQQGSYAAAAAHYQAVLALPHAAPVTLVQTLNGLSRAMWQQGEYTPAADYARRGLAIAKQIDDPRGMAHSLNNLGIVAAFGEGDYAAAERYYQESLQLRRAAGDRAGVSASLNNLGILAHDEGNHTQAQTYYQESLEIGREIGDRQGIALTLVNLGSVTHELGAYPAARGYYEESLAISRETGDRWGAALTLLNLGNVLSEDALFAEARVYFTESLQIAESIGDREGVVFSLNGLASVAHHLGDYVSAQDYYQRSLPLSRELGRDFVIADTLTKMASNEIAMETFSSAWAHLHEALALAKALGGGTLLLRIVVSAAHWWLENAQPERAAALLGVIAARSTTPMEAKQLGIAQLTAELEKLLSAETLAAAKAAGAGLQLDDVVADLLKTLAADTH